MGAILNVIVALVRLAAFLLAAGAASLAVLAAFGFASRWLDVLTHFAPFLVLMALAAIGLRLATGIDGARLTVLVSLAAIALSAVVVAPELIALARPSDVPAGGERLKLVQMNLWYLNPDPEGTARWIAAEDPDVVVLEEVNGRAARVPALLREQYPYQTSCAPPWPCSTMILSKRRPSAFGGLQAPVSPLRLAGVWVTFGEGEGAFTVAGVHYAWPIPPGRLQSQMARLADALKRFDRRGLILAGDMNATPWSYTLRAQDRALGLERRTRALFSWPAAPMTRWRVTPPLPFLPIDHVYAGSDWATVSVRRGPAVGSDHYPVIVQLRRRR
jgi:endonuclease/exonuclease/phosphatase (EEP) superfamily protein YafD